GLGTHPLTRTTEQHRGPAGVARPARTLREVRDDAQGRRAMELTRRQLLTLAGSAAVAAALAGCGGTLRPADVEAPGFGENASGTLNLWCRSDTVNGTQAVVDAFHRAQDRIRVRVTPIQNGQYVTKLATAIR